MQKFIFLGWLKSTLFIGVFFTVLVLTNGSVKTDIFQYTYVVKSMYIIIFLNIIISSGLFIIFNNKEKSKAKIDESIKMEEIDYKDFNWFIDRDKSVWHMDNFKRILNSNRYEDILRRIYFVKYSNYSQPLHRMSIVYIRNVSKDTVRRLISDGYTITPTKIDDEYLIHLREYHVPNKLK